jgi:hypothetical protein
VLDDDEHFLDPHLGERCAILLRGHHPPLALKQLCVVVAGLGRVARGQSADCRKRCEN